MKYEVLVTQRIELEIDETKFTEEFMEKFRKYMYKFNDIDDHARHLAHLYARGIVGYFDDFIEGYGPIKEMGIKFINDAVDDVKIIDDL